MQESNISKIEEQITSFVEIGILDFFWIFNFFRRDFLEVINPPKYIPSYLTGASQYFNRSFYNKINQQK